MPPSVSTGTEEKLGRDDYLQAPLPSPQLRHSFSDFSGLQCPYVSFILKAFHNRTHHIYSKKSKTSRGHSFKTVVFRRTF